jgi:hypothetical protein
MAPSLGACSTPINGHSPDQPVCLKRAISGSERTHSITSSAVARSVSSRSCRLGGIGAFGGGTDPLALALSPTAGACWDHGPIVSAPVAPHIAVPVPAEITFRIAICWMQDD